MKILKIIGGIILAAVAFFLIAGLFMSKDYHYEKSMTINAAPEKIWPQVSVLKNHNNWSPYMKLDPNAKVEYFGEDATVGSSMTWDGNEDAGKGSQTITALEPLKSVTTELVFIEPFNSKAKAYFTLAPENNGTKVTWGFDSHSPYPYNAMGLFFNMDEMFDKDYTAGLTNMKSVCEQ